MRRGGSAAMIAGLGLLFLSSAAANAPTIGPDSALPVPRFVSLKVEGAHGRRGPGVDHRVEWIYQRAGLPLQVIAESGPWRRVVDPDGAEVWMHAQNLDQRRTGYVREATALRRSARPGAAVVAYLSPGVIGAMTGCESEWRRFAVGGRVGWVEARALWAGDCESS